MLGQLDVLVEPQWVKALYRAGIGHTNSGEPQGSIVRVELLESAT